MNSSSAQMPRWVGRRGARRGALGSVVLALALLVGACGQTGGVVPPDTLTITVSPLGGSAQTYTVRDGGKVQGIYQHMLALPIIPSGASPACRVTRQSERFAFSTSGSPVLTATIGECANILQTPNNVNRAPDTTFWAMVDGATGQRLEPV